MNLYLGAKRMTKDPELADDPIVQEAARYLDIPYVFGGSTPEAGFDCSGLVQYVLKTSFTFTCRDLRNSSGWSVRKSN